MQKKSPIYVKTQNDFNAWKLKDKNLKKITPKRMLPCNFKIDVNKLPLVDGKIHFIRIVDSNGQISVLNEYFNVGKEYIGEYVWTTVETRKQTLVIYYKDENLEVREIKKFDYEICEKVYYCNYSAFRSDFK